MKTNTMLAIIKEEIGAIFHDEMAQLRQENAAIHAELTELKDLLKQQ